MTKVRFLILTDHSGHSEHNSLYALTRALAADARTKSVLVASRGDKRNEAFFTGDLEAKIYVAKATAHFDFEADGRQFISSNLTTTFKEAETVWLRLPPSEDQQFLSELIEYSPSPSAGVNPVIINHPAGIIETGSKAFLANFSEHTAPIKRIFSELDFRRWIAQHETVLKPLQAYGGRGIVRIQNEQVEENGQLHPLDRWIDANRHSIESGHYLAMKFLKNVSQGDKRILVVNGHILGASLRIPAEGNWLCNVAQGGSAIPADVSPEEEGMIAAISPVLLDKGVVIFGADTLVDDDGRRVLSELNTNSIGGFPQAEAQSNRPVLKQTIDGIYDYLDRYL
ncbi:MAG: glutathione synthetase [Bacteroidota bacterium]